MTATPTQLAPNLYLLPGAVNTGVLVADGRALLFDCCDSVTPERLAGALLASRAALSPGACAPTDGVEAVEMVLCTQHRRPNVAGAYRFAEAGARVVAPGAEQHLFERVDDYWGDWRNRWHLYHAQPGPQVLALPLPVARGVSEGDAIEWRGHAIRVLETPGATDGSVSYLVEAGGKRICFSGDAIYGPGQLLDVYSLQKGFGVISDYHGFLGNRRKLLPSLDKLAGSGADVLVPAHGQPIRELAAAIALLKQRLEALWRNYSATSALNHCFPHLLDDTREDPQRMAPAETRGLPGFVRRVGHTSYAVVSESGAALLVDCWRDGVVETLQEWLSQGTIRSLDGCWVSHYHDDHVDGLGRLTLTFGCPILTDEHMADIIEHPTRYLLPCISPNAAPVARATKDGESWQWREFRLTAFHFPGHSLYHGGLLVEGRGTSVFFAGDSGAPTGLDDYCAGNRNFLGAGRGSRRCLEIWRQHRPEHIVNQHQERSFHFSDEQLDYMEAMLVERERLLAEMLPWPHPDFGTDEHWARAYPYEQEAAAGSTIAIEVHLTNHGPESSEGRVEPVLPEGWRWDTARGDGRLTVTARTDGLATPFCERPDGVARLWLTLPEDTAPGRYVVPLRLTWGRRYLGQIRHAVVEIR